MRLLSKPMLCVILLFSLLACRYDMPLIPKRHVEVILDMTSGVPPPTWTLTRSEIETMEQMLHDLPSATSSSIFDGLGYRGFVVTFNADERLVRVQNGYVVVQEAGKEHIYIDTDNQLEKWLLSGSKSHIDPQLYSFLEEGIGR